MNREAIFKRYIDVANVLGQMFPSLLEVVIHDFANIDSAILHIVNGNISGRQIGGPASEVSLRRLVEDHNFPDCLVNFTSKSARGQQLKSSSIAIRDDEGKLIGSMCMHFDITQFDQFGKLLQFFVSTKSDSIVGVNDFGASLQPDEEIKNEIDSWTLKQGLYSSQLSYKDKQALVVHLYQKGFFNKRGAITLVSNMLQLTRQCVYNYIDIARGPNEQLDQKLDQALQECMKATSKLHC